MEQHTYAVIVAGGKGSRMGSDIPKQFLPLLGKPMLCYAIEAFAQAIPGINIILVVPASDLSSAEIVIKSYLPGIEITFTSGGETRFHSVQRGLNLILEKGIVFVHDGARPLISTDLICRCYAQAVEKGSAIPAIPVTESMRIITGEESKPVNRDALRAIQTPQTFKTQMLMPAFGQLYNESFTDEASVVEAFGNAIYLIAGERSNIKVTTPEDMIIAELLLKHRQV